MTQTQVRGVPSFAESERLNLEVIAPADPREGLIRIDPERVSGASCFAGTRVPIKHLWDYLEGGEPLGEFLEGFPGVTREQAIGVLEMALQRFLEGLPHP